MCSWIPWMLFVLSSVSAFPQQNSCSEGAVPVQGSALLQRRGVHSQVLPAKFNDNETPSAMSMVELNLALVDSDNATLQELHQHGDAELNLVAVEPPESDSDDIQTRIKHILKVLQDTIIYVKSTDGPGEATTLQEATDLLASSGLAAVQSNSTQLSAILEAFDIFSLEMSVEDAAQTGEVITSRDYLLVKGVPESEDPQTNDAEFGYIEGDIMVDSNETLLQEEIDAGQRWTQRLWQRDQPLKVCVRPEFSDDENGRSRKRFFFQALQHIRTKLPCAVTDFEVGVYPDCRLRMGEFPPGVCSATVGMMSPTITSTIRIGRGCNSFGTILHEIGHVLGMFHEQSRPDRDKKVQIHWDNIKSKGMNQFGKSLYFIDEEKLPYDMSSVMHYGSHHFSSNGKATITAKVDTTKVMGNAMGLTESDVRLLAEMYQCSANLKNFCPRKGCTTDRCRCEQHAISNLLTIKVTNQDGCHKCVPQCPDCGANGCNCPLSCYKAIHTNGRAYCVQSGTSDISCLTGKRLDPRQECSPDLQKKIDSWKLESPSALPQSTMCRDVASSTFCTDHAAYCNNSSFIIKHKLEHMNFAAEACAKTCGHCT